MGETNGVHWLDDGQQAAWRSFVVGNARFWEALSAAHDAELDLNLGEYTLLVQLSEQPDRTQRMSALADGLVLSRSRLTHTVARMEQRGLVSRCPADGDRRGVNCRMTDLGYAALVAAAPGHVRAVRRLLVDILDPEEMQALGRIMGKIGAAARHELTGDPRAC
ncbi:MarR family winged helix-turn-helix transcriptional regulator [Myceligenerans pegani]|uniref:MarR family transcriptional regulator n=1 Tax=Myceligenerans pegani TaxID=2776917 RepID=A0ABR9N4M2_9MICO|nr:MarR family transcriptional regulator [Myceligenerans sp. TRM 65318]MBE1878627.1 MarR family transcriptional regulator [Myceligenerans sp. TRM 65318]MBE3020898.1 MarR family transcriptional regulator [Myceligenerans sp. TRM 65318]